MNDVEVFLYKGYFWSAASKYGWFKDDPGVGIEYKKIEKALPKGRIYVKSRYDYMSISAKLAVEIVKKYKSIYYAGPTKLGIIPKSRFVKEIAQPPRDWRLERKVKKATKLKEGGQGVLI